MLDNFPSDFNVALDWQWDDWQPHYQALLEAELTADSIDAWLKAWTQVGRMSWETYARLSVAKDVDTNDEAAEAKYKNFMANIYPHMQKFQFMLSKKLVDSQLAPPEVAIPMRNIKAAIEIFSEDNLPLMTKMSELTTQYNKISGKQTIMWEGKELTLRQVEPIFRDTDRSKREKAWKLMQDRMLQDREDLNAVWEDFMTVRRQIADNTGFDNYRDYIWKEKGRFDYSPDDALAFCDAIEQVVVPAVERLSEQRRQQLGYDALMPWDLNVDPSGRDPITPYDDMETFIAQTEAIFNQVDPELGAYFRTMREEELLDLDNRKGKAPGGYCTTFPNSKRPFIFMNAVGLDMDVRTLLHEAGHAFHAFSAAEKPYMMMQRAPMEFNEVASMAMELLAAPYLTEEHGGYFSEADAARYRADHLRKIINFWPYMAVVVAFQHWIYSNHELATDPVACDKKWLELWGRFMKGADYSGFDEYVVNRWRRQLHIYRVPFYYIEYGLAQLGAVQVWANALQDQASALAKYRDALKLGGTVTLPELYETAGAKLAFDAATLQEALDLIENTLNELEPA